MLNAAPSDDRALTMPQDMRLTVCRGEVTKTPRKAGLAARPTRIKNGASSRGRGTVAGYGAMAIGGLMLVVAFAFAGHYMGQNAIAHNAEPGDMIESLSQPASNLLAKGSLVPGADSLATINKSSPGLQTVAGDGKSDLVVAEQQTVRIVPASVNLRPGDDELDQQPVLTPPGAKVVQVIALERSTVAKRAKSAKSKEAQKAIAQRRSQQAEENCLARAVYFEARSESDLGQLAVAKVILNRVKDPEYPKTICGVVYQGSGRRNSCQFSFACDGLPDDVRSAKSWAHAKSIARRAIAGDAQVAAIGTATNYHADYVKPRWAKSMKRLIKIGRHVFYEDS